MNENLYYYLLDNNYLTHGIGEASDEETYFKLESIIKHRGLMSLQKLRELGINVSGKVSGYRNTPDNQISFFNPALPEIKKRLLSKNYYYFLPFHPDVVFFIVDRGNIDLQQNPTIPFEINSTSEFVSIDNFKGIIAPREYAEYLDSIQKKYGVCLPIYDFDFNITNSLDVNENKKI